MGFNERIAELMWPSGETGDGEADAGPSGTAAPRAGLFGRLRQLGIAEHDAAAIVERQRGIDTETGRRRH